jgi:glycosyltransferase involved in cell wall biosynthesis
MRIAHIITRLIIGGAQENTLLTCQDLMQLYGDQVLLITGPGLGPEGSLEDEARGRGVALRILPELRREIHPFRDVMSYRSLRRAIADFRPDVVHTHSGKAGLLGRMAAWSRGVPAVVHTVHGAPFHAYQPAAARALLRACERYAARRCHAIVSVADAMTRQLVKAGVAPAEKFVTIPSGMEVDSYLAAERHRQRVRGELGYKSQHIVVGKIARLFHLKGHEDLIRAASRVVTGNPAVRFLLVGGGILENPLRAQVARAGLTDYFHFTGLVPPAQIAELLGAMDIVVHVSLREGLARALPQALIAEKPVVSYDIDGACEVVLPGETGCLVAPRDVAGLATAILELACDAPLRERLGIEGRRRFANPFRHQTMTARLRELYTAIPLSGVRP